MTERLRGAYFELLDDLVGYREQLETDDLDRWLTNLDAVRSSLDERATSLGFTPPAALVAPWPDETVGARIHATPDGHLVLFNTGTASASDALSRCASILFDGYPEEAAHHLVNVVVATWNADFGAEVVNAIPWMPENADGIRMLTSFAATYPLCHEYAHALLGHTSDAAVAGLLDVRRTWRSEGDVLWNQRKELDADRLALELLLAGVPVGAAPDAVAGAERYSVLAAAMVHGYNGLVLLRPWSEGRFDVGDGHPPPFVRRYAVLDAAREIGIGHALTAAGAFTEWLDGHVMPAVQALIERMDR